MRSAILKLGYRAGALLDAVGVGRFALLRRLRRALRRVLTHDRDLLVELEGLQLYIRSDTETARQYLLSPFEPFTTALWKRAIGPGARVLDIGAQFGYFALLAAKQAGSTGTVYAFEPVASNYRLLQRNILVNVCGSITAVQKAVSDANTVVPMFVYQESDSHSMYRHPQASVKEVVAVASVALDDFLAGRDWDVIKMDIEGHEPAALRGMEETIARSADLVLFAELAPAYLRRAGMEPRAYLAQLERLGFAVRLIDEEAKRLGPVTDDVLAAAERDPNWYANLYCTKGVAGPGDEHLTA
jgi:FkbM family methyltransferase